MDSSCAKMGSHEMMEKQHNMPSNAASDKACTVACVKAGAKLVLYDASTKTVYELDDQKKAEQFAGEKVKLTGTIDKDYTIHVAKIAYTGRPIAAFSWRSPPLMRANIHTLQETAKRSCISSGVGGAGR